MLLAVDVGNTHIVIGFIREGEILHIVRVHTNAQETETEYAIKLRQIMDFAGLLPGDFEGAILSSVVPPVTEAMAGAIRMVTGCRCLLLGPGVKTGLNVRIDDPSTLAGDLVAGSVAAVACYGAPVIVLDLGTATTIVAVDKNNCYLGGAILPGVRSSYTALVSGTSLLPDISIRAPKRCIGANTVDAMRSGAVFGAASAIDGMLERMEEELGYPCKAVATGGLARAVTPYCKREILCDDDLLLKGLWVIYQKNRRETKNG